MNEADRLVMERAVNVSIAAARDHDQRVSSRCAMAHWEQLIELDDTKLDESE